jgi:SpoIID/LytB domain protein
VLGEAELAQSLNKQYNIGRIVSIELGDRGPGGRLQWVRIKGTSKTEVIRKELNIRRAFGGLPSALCIMDTERAPDGSRKFIFRGGGRGHGVGLCQHGTRGMVAQGSSYRDVLAHYFTGTTLERLE